MKTNEPTKIIVIPRILFVLLLLIVPLHAAPVTNWITLASDGSLREGANVFRFSGPNINTLGLLGSKGSLAYPTRFQIESDIYTVKEMGGNVIRTHGFFSVGPTNQSVDPNMTIEPTLGNFNAAAFAPVDYAVKLCKDNGIRLIGVLCDNYLYDRGGKHVFLTWRGLSFTPGDLESEKLFYSNTTVRQDFKNYISAVLNHTNVYTGVAYRNEPAIFAWELGNELNPPSDGAWVQDIANHIHNLAPNAMIVHPRCAGSKSGWNVTGLSLTNVHIYQDHEYGSSAPDTAHIEYNANLARTASPVKKAFMVGEFDWQNTNSLSTPLTNFLYSCKTNMKVSGTLYWVLYPSDKTMGYYHRTEDYCLQWPGSDSDPWGLGYDPMNKATRAKLLRQHAYEIRAYPSAPSIPQFTHCVQPLMYSPTRETASTVRLKWRHVLGADKYQIWKNGVDVTPNPAPNGFDNDGVVISGTTNDAWKIEAVSIDGAASRASCDLVAIDDAFIDSVNSSANYGSTNKLWVSTNYPSGTPIRKAFLKFDFGPYVPGQFTSIASATLRIKVVSDSAANSGGTFNVHYCSNKSWSETNITWNSASAYTGPVAGYLLKPTDLGTWYEIPLDQNNVLSSINSDLASADKRVALYLDLSTSGSSETIFYSTEAANPEDRPQLLFTFDQSAAPPAPGNVIATAISTSEINLAWNASAGATGYNVKRSATSGGTYTTIGSPTGTTFSDTGRSSGTRYYYVVSALNGTDESTDSTEASAITYPAAPANLAAGASSTQVTLTWNASTGASYYNVKRSTTSSGSYSTIASPSGTSYTDTDVISGTTYYYVVNAVNSTGGQGPNSSERPASVPLPASFAGQDIGAVGITGSATSSNGIWTVTGSGADIYGTSDQFYFVSRGWTGDVEIVTRVVTVDNTSPYAKGGIMIRETLAENSPMVMTDVTPGSGIEFMRRYAIGGSAANTKATGLTAPYWLKLVRSLDTIAAYRSTDGMNWVLSGSDTVNMGATIYIGLVVTSHTNGALCTATFDNFTVDTPWTSDDIGSVAMAGSASVNALTGSYTVSGSGPDIWGTADAFQFVDQPLYGNGEIVARVSSVQNTDPYAKAGVMVRESLAANSKHALIDVTPSMGSEFIRRLTTGGSSTNNRTLGIAAPYWVKLVRSNSTFSAYHSTNGMNWTLNGTDTITMSTNVYIGLSVTSHTTTNLNTSVFDNVTISPVP